MPVTPVSNIPSSTRGRGVPSSQGVKQDANLTSVESRANLEILKS